MKIIGHRGAAWLALENTLESFRAAKQAGVDAIEFDIHLTRDGEFVVSHDTTTGRTGDQDLVIKDHTLKQLKSVLLHNGERMPTLEEAVEAIGDTRIVVETKGSKWARPLAKKLQHYPNADIIVIAQDHRELARFRKLMPGMPAYVVQRFNPIDTLQTLHDAHQHQFTGVDLNFWLLTPLTYWLAERYKLDIIVYSVNHLWIARFLRFLFPDITITTDRPDRLQSLRTHATEHARDNG